MCLWLNSTLPGTFYNKPCLLHYTLFPTHHSVILSFLIWCYIIFAVDAVPLKVKKYSHIVQYGYYSFQKPASDWLTDWLTKRYIVFLEHLIDTDFGNKLFLRNPEVHYHVHESLPSDPIHSTLSHPISQRSIYQQKFPVHVSFFLHAIGLAHLLITLTEQFKNNFPSDRKQW
jgi:hypothetical protein